MLLTTNLMVLTSEEGLSRLFGLDFQLLADAVLTLIAIFVLCFVFSFFLFKPVRKILEDRSEMVKEENDGLKKKVDEQTESIRQHAADLATAKTSLEYTEKELEAERQRLEEEKRRTAEVEEELARMKSAGWWKRLRRKW